MNAKLLGRVLLGGLALGLAACADSEEDNGPGDGGIDSGIDAGADTDSETDTGAPPPGGTSCADPVEVPDEPLVWSYVAGWSGFPDDTFDPDGGLADCEDGSGNTVWFHLTVPASYEIIFHLNDEPLVWVNTVESCDATECLASDLAMMSSSPVWENTSGEDRVVYMAIESNDPIMGDGVIDWTFERAAI
jgi:hypothetical protein